jgi:hypothetical protein
MSNAIEEIIGHLRNPFIIKEDGSRQTDHANTGRVGFHVEKLFGVTPNNDRTPDLGQWELKTIRKGTKVTIGTMPDNEVRRICKETTHDFGKSDPYKKMKNTLFVVYDKLSNYPEPKYIMNGWGACKLDNMSVQIKNGLQADYERICKVIKLNATNQTDLTEYLRTYGSVSGELLSLGYKGQGSNGYNYPAWSFTAKFVGKLNHA